MGSQDIIWSNLNVQFHQPMYVGEKAEMIAEVVHVSEAVRCVEISLAISCGNKRILSGNTLVSFLSDAAA